MILISVIRDLCAVRSHSDVFKVVRLITDMSQIKLISRASRVLSGAAVRSELTLGEAVSAQPRGRHTSVRTMASQRKTLTLETLNPNIKTLEYAVRGPLVTRAAELEKELEKVFIPKYYLVK